MIKEKFGQTKSGEQIYKYTYRDKSGMEISATEYGASLVSVRVPDRDGNFRDVVLGYDDVSGYERQYQCVGNVIGRTCNRIADASFTLNGEKFNLTRNFGPHHMHGGIRGFSRRIWTCYELENGLEFHYVSPDGEENYPGTLIMSVRYIIENGNKLKLEYIGHSDKDTICNLTNHSYFNLNGYNSGDILNHYVQLNCDCFTEANKYAFPNGNILPVEGTVMDFRNGKRIGADIDSDYSQVAWYGGYDSNYGVTGYDGSKTPKPLAYAYAEESGIEMIVETTMPGVQFYTGNSLEDAPMGKGGNKIKKYQGFCLETQYFPDAMAHENFVKPILRAGETYHHITTYEFKIKK